MNLFRNIVNATMLAVAAVGAGPLWLHKELHHHCECTAASSCQIAYPCDGVASTCDAKGSKERHQHSQGSHSTTESCASPAVTECGSCLATPVAPGPVSSSSKGAFDADDHECGLCFNLSQAQVVQLAHADDLTQLLPQVVVSNAQGLTVTQFSRPPPSRGPPSING